MKTKITETYRVFAVVPVKDKPCITKPFALFLGAGEALKWAKEYFPEDVEQGTVVVSCTSISIKG